jgi:hypothetical protein
MANKLVWSRRFATLKAEGLTNKQLDAVFIVLEQSRAFHYRWIEYSAKRQLEKVKQGEYYE